MLKLRKEMASFNQLEHQHFYKFSDICIKGLGIKYDIRDPFSVLK